MVLDIDDLDEVSSYLFRLSKDDIYYLGLILGLVSHTLKQHNDLSQRMYLSEVLEAWLREQDKVGQKSGPPTWRSLVNALKNDQLGQNGIARKIEEDKLQQSKGIVWEVQDKVVEQVEEGRRNEEDSIKGRQRDDFEEEMEEEEEGREVQDVEEEKEMVGKPKLGKRVREPEEVTISARRLRLGFANRIGARWRSVGFASQKVAKGLIPHRLNLSTWNVRNY